MGKRKREMAERLKEIKRQTAIAKVKNVPSSPRKMRYVTDMIKGMEVNRALDILKYSTKDSSKKYLYIIPDYKTIFINALNTYLPKTSRNYQPFRH